MRAFALILLLLMPVTAAAQDDRSYLTAFLEDNLSSVGRVVVVTGFAGALSSKATVQELTIADDAGVWLTLRDVSLEWNRAALFSGAVSINTLRAGEIVLERLPVAGDALPSAEARSFALPELPVSVEIGSLLAEKITLGAAVLGSGVEGRLEASLSLIGGEGQADLVLERTDDGPAGRLVLAASYANAGQNLSVDLDAREEAGGIAAGLLRLPGVPSAALTVQGAGPLADFVARIALQTDDVPRLAGEVRLTGNSAGSPEGEQGFAADLRGDLAPLFLPNYAAFFGPEVSLRATGKRFADGKMTLSNLAVQAEALDLQGAVDLAADGLPERIAITGRIGLDARPVLLPLTTEVETRIDKADLVITYDKAVSESWSLKGTVLGLDRADFKARKLTLLGSGLIARDGGARRFSMAMDFDTEGLIPVDPALATALGPVLSGKASLYWREGDGVVSLPDLTITGEDYDAKASGTIAGIKQALTLTGTLDAQVKDASRFAALAGLPVSGATSLTITGNGSPLTGAFDLEGAARGRDMRAGLAALDNLLRGQAQIGFSARRDTNGTELRRLSITAATLAVTARGKIASAGSTLQADVRFDDIAVLGEGYRGALTGRAGFAGTVGAGRLTLNATARDLGLGVPQLDGLLQGDSLLVLDLGLEDGAVRITTASLANPQAQTTVTGRWSAADSDLQAGVSLGDLALLGQGYRGALSGKAAFTGSAASGTLNIDATGRGLGIGVTEVDRLLGGTSAVTARLMLRDGVVQVQSADLRNPQLVATATGTLQGSRQTVDIVAELKNLGLLLPEFPGALKLRGRAVQDGGGTTLDLTGTGPGRIAASVKGKIAPGFGRADLAIRGTAQAALANALITPRAVSGNLNFDLRLNGPLAISALAGTVSLSDGRLADPGQNFALQAITARAALAGGRANLTARSTVSTGGEVAARGSVGLAAPYAADLALEIARVTLRDPDLYETTANGALTISGPLAGGALIAGRVALTQTELRVPSTGFGGAGDLPGLRHLNEPAPQRATRARAGQFEPSGSGTATAAPYRLDIVISAPNRVFLRGRGLDAELGGELLLRGTTWAVQPAGALSLIRGRLEILGKRLDLDEAVLQMQGELVPFLRIVASTENDGITTSVVIDGPADNPVVSFESSPQLPQEEVLAQLLFGQTLQDLSPLQALQLAAAVRTLAGKGGDGLVAKLRQGIGLDNLDVKTATDGTSSITAGKYLTDKIYSEVTVDQNGKSQINLNLDLRKHITLRGRASSDGTTGFGILLEKDY